jgi:signal transduction histidine kinase
MLDNLKLVLIQHKKFLAIFFVVVFLPSIILAFFGIRAIRNERYKILQQNLDQQKQYVSSIKAGVCSIVDRDSLGLKELASSKAVLDQNFLVISKSIAQCLQDESLLGQIVIWNDEGPSWLLGWQSRPASVNTLVVPREWEKWRSGLAKAERAEFRRRNFSEAIFLYLQILDKAVNDQVKAWILSRIARCEIKQKNLEGALTIYRSIVSDFADLLTESGRPLGVASRLEMLEAFRLDKNHESFYAESLVTFRMLEQNVWSLDGDQIKLYSDMLKNMIDEVVSVSSPSDVPDGYDSSVGDIQDAVDKRLKIWRMAEAVRRNILPDAIERLEKQTSVSPQVQKNVFEFESNDVIVLMIPMNKDGSGQNQEFLGSLLQISDLTESIHALIKENRSKGVSVLLRSTLTGNIVFSDADAAEGSPIITDFFPENFPPWRLELYQIGDGKSGLTLHKNIFFWTILALLVIVVFGSGLIIRTLVQEVNLLNLKSEFIASVSHEFKTPLTSMGAVLERLMDDEVKDSQKTKEYYRILRHDSDKLKRLVKNVLDFTKIEEGKRDYKKTSVDIIQLVRQEVGSFQEENRMSGFRVEIQTDDEIPAVFADEEAISQALHNILDNAAKFSGPVKDIEVRVIRRQDSVEIAVQDRGVGIPESEQKKVFEKFYRGKKASSVSPTGTGLGLTLVRHIMNAHLGDVVIKSQPGKGTCVSLILPIGKGG